METLPRLNQGRRAHGCGSYIKDGKKVFQTFLIFLIILDLKKYLVVGGFHGPDFFSSTETWSPGDSSWTTVSLSPLPRPVTYAGSVSLNNNIYLFGIYFNNLGDCSLIFLFCSQGTLLFM